MARHLYPRKYRHWWHCSRNRTIVWRCTEMDNPDPLMPSWRYMYDVFLICQVTTQTIITFKIGSSHSWQDDTQVSTSARWCWVTQSSAINQIGLICRRGNATFGMCKCRRELSSVGILTEFALGMVCRIHTIYFELFRLQIQYCLTLVRYFELWNQ